MGSNGGWAGAVAKIKRLIVLLAGGKFPKNNRRIVYSALPLS